MNPFGFLKEYWSLFLLGILVIFLYTYNLDKNSRYIWDESRALVDMHRIWEQKEVTFVGPISEDKLEMFPSLSYYMYLPATILSNFDPLGPAYMAAFYGAVAWFLLTITIIKKIGVNSKSLVLSLLIAVLSPVMVTSRWAWNPNPVIFWVSLFIFSLSFDNPIITILGGISLGASLYHHYLAAFGVIPAILFLPILYRGSKDIFKKIGLTIMGFSVSLIPFVIFELKNHYFQNLGNFLSANGKSFISFSLSTYIEHVRNGLVVFSSYFVPNDNLFTITFIIIITIIFLLYKKDNVIRYSFITLLSSLLLFGFVTNTYPHYQYSQVPFIILFFIQFIYINKYILGKIFVVTLLIISIISAINMINEYTWQGDIVAVRNVTKHLLDEKNQKTNVAALASPDPNLYGQRYRDTALINGKTLDAFDKFPQSEVLYVVSTSKDAQVLREDQAWEIESFKGSTITNMWEISDYPMYLYRFEKL